MGGEALARHDSSKMLLCQLGVVLTACCGAHFRGSARLPNMTSKLGTCAADGCTACSQVGASWTRPPKSTSCQSHSSSVAEQLSSPPHSSQWGCWHSPLH